MFTNAGHSNDVGNTSNVTDSISNPIWHLVRPFKFQNRGFRFPTRDAYQRINLWVIRIILSNLRVLFAFILWFKPVSEECDFIQSVGILITITKFRLYLCSLTLFFWYLRVNGRRFRTQFLAFELKFNKYLCHFLLEGVNRQWLWQSSITLDAIENGSLSTVMEAALQKTPALVCR